jgi:hypothetical protein
MPRRDRLRIPIGLAFGLAAAGSWGGVARAADVRLHAPNDCADVQQIITEAETLLGRSLASIDGIDFDVVIAEGAHKRWQLRVVATDRASGDRRAREIAGLGCAELAEAAAVAITMSITSTEKDPDAEAPAPKPPAPPPPPPPPPRPVVAPAPPPDRKMAVGVSAVGDMGTLPGLAYGAEVQGRRRFGALRLAGVGTFLPGQDGRLASGAGGSFQLLAGGLMLCVGRRPRSIDILGCIGGEAGQLSGEGLDVNHPRTGRALWMAGRAEVGVTVAVSPRWGADLRVGVVVPVRRPVFVLEETVPVHQPSAAIARVSLGVDYDF